ncbi:MAG TPA: hypothetical protein DHW02_00290, partial [Ktedonobacter sp.]|nr:hypothetical protein [Ktedonobacter sp.]
MPQRILIIGGGVGGTIVANVLARVLHPHEAEVTLIAQTDKHVYMPNWLYIPFNDVDIDSEQLVRPEHSLLNKHVHLVKGLVKHINVPKKEVQVEYDIGQETDLATAPIHETILNYDYLVLAPGARIAPEDLSGLGEGEGNGKWNHFYSADGAMQLRHALH